MRLIEPPGGRPWALLGLCAASLVLNVVLVTRLALADSESVAAVDASPPIDAVAAAAVVPDPIASTSKSEVPDGVHVVHATVEHSLARTFQSAAPEHGDVLSAVYARLFVWDLDLRTDLQAGDEIAVAYEWDGALAHIPVASFSSKKLGRTLNAYRFKASSDRFASWWDETGQEMSMRLVDGPLPDYEQVTSLLKDRPRHRGMDFKVPDGTAVVAPKVGTVVRTNWNIANNGNCVELRYGDGTLARFLHLSRTDVEPGERVAAGETLGLSGNTGHSTAPHLHYELERNGGTIDPIDYHGVVRRTLSDADRQAFDSERQRLDRWLVSAT